MSASKSFRTVDRWPRGCTLTAAVVSLRGRPRFLPVYVARPLAPVLGIPRRFPVRPSVDLILLTRVVLMVPSNPAACHASFTVSTLLWGWSFRNSLTNIVFPGLLAGLDIWVADIALAAVSGFDFAR